MLNNIPMVLIDEDRTEMERWPDKDGFSKVVFDFNKDNASGPNGFSGEFYQV